MSKSNRQCIGSVRGRGFSEFEQCPHHERNLLLVCSAPPYNGLLNPFGCIFENLHAVFRSGKNRCSTSGAHRNRGLIALHEDHTLDRADLRVVFVDYILELLSNPDETTRLTQIASVLDCTVGQSLVGRFATGRDSLDHSKTGIPQSGINGEDAHGERLHRYQRLATAGKRTLRQNLVLVDANIGITTKLDEPGFEILLALLDGEALVDFLFKLIKRRN